MKLRSIVLFAALALIAGAAVLFCEPGCAALDQAAPEFAPHAATTQPTSQPATPPTPPAKPATPASPATPRNVPGELATVITTGGSNPVIGALVSMVPYGSLALNAILALSAGVLAWSRASHKSRADAAEDTIAAAAPEVSNLVTQAGSPIAGSIITAGAAIAPAIIDLLNHPAAQNVPGVAKVVQTAAAGLAPALPPAAAKLANQLGDLAGAVSGT
jgi:hypothetical protein